jgi:hypothetical protein
MLNKSFAPVLSGHKFKRHDKVQVTDKYSRFFGATGNIVASLKGGSTKTDERLYWSESNLNGRCRVKYNTPQEDENYKYSWFWENELSLVQEIKPSVPALKVGDKVRVLHVGRKGQTGTIAAITDRTFQPIRVIFTDFDDPVHYDAIELEIIQKDNNSEQHLYRFLEEGETILPTDKYVPINTTTDGTLKVVSSASRNNYLRKVN